VRFLFAKYFFVTSLPSSSPSLDGTSRHRTKSLPANAFVRISIPLVSFIGNSSSIVADDRAFSNRKGPCVHLETPPLNNAGFDDENEEENGAAAASLPPLCSFSSTKTSLASNHTSSSSSLSSFSSSTDDRAKSPPLAAAASLLLRQDKQKHRMLLLLLLLMWLSL
jgi:hypothetical protein